MSEKSEAAQLERDLTQYGFNRQDLDAKGERAVKADLDSGKYGYLGLAPAAFVSAWLDDKEFARKEECISLSRANAASSREAAASARLAARWAIWAAIIAITAIAIANIDKILALILGNS